MLSYREKIHEYVTAHKDEALEILKALVRIPSVRGEALPQAPFGKECAEALRYTEELYGKYGLETEYDADGGYLLSFLGEGEHSLGIFAHADVVAVGDGWVHTAPFEPREVDGFLVGRGVMDDKAAIVASLFAARIIRDLEIPFKSRLVLFTGSNEESGMGDVKNYLKKHTPPDFALVPDTCFPLYRGNKGRILMKATKNAPLGEIKSLECEMGGTNIGDAKARIGYSDGLFEHLRGKASDNLSVTMEDGCILLSAQGIKKHTALPEGSLNAVALIADALRDYDGFSLDLKELYAFLYGICSDYYGAFLGIDCEDGDFGKLTFVNYGARADGEFTELYFNIRSGDGADREAVKARLAEHFSHYGFSVEILDESEPHIVPADHPMLLSLMKTFEEYTGKSDGKMYVNAGGTYAQRLPCAAEIGVSLYGGHPDGTPNGHGAVHQCDECISIEGFLGAIELTTLMLLNCDKEINENV